MSAEDYINMIISTNPIIYLDTASIMETSELAQFIEKSGEILQRIGRQIIIPEAVCLEIVRHLCSENTEKQGKALKALELLKEHHELFDIRNHSLRSDDINTAFADAELLAELTRNKNKYRQLLITNDRALGQDALELNSLSSCHGHKIMVCYINALGELRKSSCTNTDIDKVAGKVTADTHFNNLSPAVNAEKPALISTPKDLLIPNSGGSPVVLKALIPVGSFILGFLTCRYAKHVIKAFLSYSL